jgi:hypothetical protein
MCNLSPPRAASPSHESHNCASSAYSRLLPNAATKAQIRFLLRSHSQPPENLSATISELSEVLARSDNEVSSYEYPLSSAKAECPELRAYYDDLCRLFSPVRRLPSEILVDIFALHMELCAPSLVQNYMELMAKAPLLAVSQVCAQWHEIALGTPSLWAAIEICDNGALWRTPELRTTSMALLRLALDRGAHL